MSSASLVFVAGNSRSGITVLARVPGLHSRIHTFPELHFVEEIWNPLIDPQRVNTVADVERLLQNADAGYFDPLERDRYSEAANQIMATIGPGAPVTTALAEVARRVVHREGKCIAGEQTQKDVYFGRDLLAAFPTCHMVVITRDPRDVVFSQKDWWRRVFRVDTFPWRSVPWLVTLRRWAQYHPWVTVAMWRGGALAGASLSDHPRVTTIRFEDLVGAPEETLTTVLERLERLELAFEPQLLEVTGTNSSHASPSATSKGLNRSPVGNWSSGLSRGEAWITERQSWCSSTCINGSCLRAVRSALVEEPEADGSNECRELSEAEQHCDHSLWDDGKGSQGHAQKRNAAHGSFVAELCSGRPEPARLPRKK